IHDLDHLARRDRLPASIARPPLSRSLANRIGLQTIEIVPAPRPVARQGSRARPSLDRRAPPSRAPDRRHNGPNGRFFPLRILKNARARLRARAEPSARPRALATHLPPGGCPESHHLAGRDACPNRGNVRPKMSTAVRTTKATIIANSSCAILT